jgi:hypothetical protein
MSALIFLLPVNDSTKHGPVALIDCGARYPFIQSSDEAEHPLDAAAVR